MSAATRRLDSFDVVIIRHEGGVVAACDVPIQSAIFVRVTPGSAAGRLRAVSARRKVVQSTYTIDDCCGSANCVSPFIPTVPEVGIEPTRY